MQYIDYDYYTNTFKGTALTQQEFDETIQRACDMIDILTKYRIEEHGWDKIHPRFQEMIKKATAAQVEYIHVNGGVSSMSTSDSDLESVHVGTFSYSTGSGGSVDASQQTGVYTNQMVLNYLGGTGLLYSGVNVVGARYGGCYWW